MSEHSQPGESHARLEREKRRKEKTTMAITVGVGLVTVKHPRVRVQRTKKQDEQRKTKNVTRPMTDSSWAATDRDATDLAASAWLRAVT